VKAVNARVQQSKTAPGADGRLAAAGGGDVGLVDTLRAVSARRKDQAAQSQLAAGMSHVGENIKRVLDQART
jgi:hypothetical protein